MKIDLMPDPLMDIHMHTTFSDGDDAPEEMVISACVKGLKTVGISDHSYTFFDESYCMPMGRISEYMDTLRELKEKYADQITVLAGIEQDFYSNEPCDGYDYVIGSVHYIRIPAADNDPALVPDGCFPVSGYIYIPVDETPEILKNAADQYFDGDIYSLISLYFDTVSEIPKKINADIIGHFDLISKFNEKEQLFSSDNPRYVSAWKKTADKLLSCGSVFEINTGAISKGYRSRPYPSPEMISYIASRGGRFILSGDAHCADHISNGFDQVMELLTAR